MKAKILIYGFMFYYVFAIIGGNLYFGVSALSFGNISFILLSLIVFVSRNLKSLTEKQNLFLTPLLVLLALVTLYLILSFDSINLRIVAKYFYLLTIPILFIVTMKIGNTYGNFFFRKVYVLVKFLLALLFLVTIMEVTLGIHMPSHGEEGQILNLPTAFFVNSNELGVMTLLLFILFVSFNEKYGKRKEYYLFIGITFFIEIITFSRIAVVSFVIFFPLYFILVRHKSIRYIMIIIVGAGITIYALTNIVNVYVPNKNLDITGWVNNRLLSIIDESTYDENARNSFAVRYAIYSYPFINPEEFILGHGLIGDEKVLSKVVRWSGITNAHSFFVELIYDFGWLGLILIITFFTGIYIFLFRNSQNDDFRYGIIFVSLFILLINVSSSIIGKPIIWAPLFVYLAYITNQENALNRKRII